MANRIRPLAICVFRNGQRILVQEGYDPLKQQHFFRPLGGRIEFWERGEETVRRELMEELRAEVEGVRYLFTLENIFTFNGEKGHEIVLVYDGRLKDESLYEREVIAGIEEGDELRAVWKELKEFGEGKPPLYPDRLLEELQKG